MPLYVCERKSTTQDITPGGIYWSRLSLDPQISLYLSAARALGFDVRGIMYDVLRVPMLRPARATPPDKRQYTKKTGELYKNQRLDDESPSEFGRRVWDAIVEDPNRYYQRQVIVRLEGEGLDAQLDVWQTASNIRDARRLRTFPRNPDSCQSWGRPCWYFPICTGITAANDPLLFRQQPRMHPELASDAPSPSSGAELLLTQSSLRTYRACPRKYFHCYEQRLRPTGVEAEVLRRGTSLHRSLEIWSKSGRDVEAATATLDRADPFEYERQRAMILGYHAAWSDKPYVFRHVESEFRTSLVNPESGASSRTFELAGKLDALVEVDDANLISVPADVQRKQLEAELAGSLARFDSAQLHEGERDGSGPETNHERQAP